MLIAPSDTIQKSSQVSVAAQVMFSITPSSSLNQFKHTVSHCSHKGLCFSLHHYSRNQVGESWCCCSQGEITSSSCALIGFRLGVCNATFTNQILQFPLEVWGEEKWRFESSSNQRVKYIPVKQLTSLKDAGYSVLSGSFRSGKRLIYREKSFQK